MVNHESEVVMFDFSSPSSLREYTLKCVKKRTTSPLSPFILNLAQCVCCEIGLLVDDVIYCSLMGGRKRILTLHKELQFIQNRKVPEESILNISPPKIYLKSRSILSNEPNL
jgi:hypothetical protein